MIYTLVLSLLSRINSVSCLLNWSFSSAHSLSHKHTDTHKHSLAKRAHQFGCMHVWNVTHPSRNAYYHCSTEPSQTRSFASGPFWAFLHCDWPESGSVRTLLVRAVRHSLSLVPLRLIANLYTLLLRRPGSWIITSLRDWTLLQGYQATSAWRA